LDESDWTTEVLHASSLKHPRGDVHSDPSLNAILQEAEGLSATTADLRHGSQRILVDARQEYPIERSHIFLCVGIAEIGQIGHCNTVVMGLLPTSFLGNVLPREERDA
jgi:hypothetical protein